MIFTYFLKSKNETYDKFVAFKNWAENKIGKRIKNVRSDNGTEFVNTNFEEMFKKAGIKHQRTVPRNPQSNGVAERANRTLLDKARTLLIHSELPNKFWAEAVSTSAYLHNRSPTKKGGPKTPVERWTGRIPSVKHIKVFGCIAYYYVAKEDGDKLQPKAKSGVFIGYSMTRRAYRVYNPEEDKVIEARTVLYCQIQ